jgi:hypothetical protein
VAVLRSGSVLKSAAESDPIADKDTLSPILYQDKSRLVGEPTSQPSIHISVVPPSHWHSAFSSALFCSGLLRCSSHNQQQATMSGRGKGKTAKKAVSQSSKAGLQFPVGRVAR